MRRRRFRCEGRNQKYQTASTISAGTRKLRLTRAMSGAKITPTTSNPTAPATLLCEQRGRGTGTLQQVPRRCPRPVGRPGTAIVPRAVPRPSHRSCSGRRGEGDVGQRTPGPGDPGCPSPRRLLSRQLRRILRRHRAERYGPSVPPASGAAGHRQVSRVRPACIPRKGKGRPH
jgi:hypothetical protein